MNITKEWLKEKSACKDGYQWSLKTLNNKPMPCDKFIKALIKDEKYQWASWVLVRVFDKPNNVRYAIFAAEQVMVIYEKKHPNNDKPRKAVEAAKKWINNPNEENRAAVHAAAYAAYVDAYDAVHAAEDAAYAAAYAAYVAADDYAAEAAAEAAAVYAGYAAYVDAYDAEAAAEAEAEAKKKMRIKILNYGLELLKEIK